MNQGEDKSSNNRRIFCYFFHVQYIIQHCLICRPSDSTVSEEAGGLLRLWHWQSDALTTLLDLIH
jgi:hypothetical protein